MGNEQWQQANLCLLATFAGLSCAEPDDSGVRGVTDDTIVIGTWSPLTGPAALWGAVGRGAELYFDMINEEGGIHGRQIEFILKDDAYQPSRTVAAVREMVERDGVFAITAGVGTASNRAVLDYLSENEVVVEDSPVREARLPYAGCVAGEVGEAVLV